MTSSAFPINGTVAWLTWRQMFANKRLYLAMIFSLAPLLVAVLFQMFSPNPAKDAHGFYLIMEKEIVIGTLLPLAAVVFGTTAFGGEVDDGTLLYLLVKPIARWRVVLSKYVIAAGSTLVMMVPAVFLPWLLVRGAEIPIGVPVAYLWGAALGAVLYSSFFVMLGLTARYSLVLGLIYVVGFEGVLSRSIPGIKALSIREFANAFTLKIANTDLNLGTPLLTMRSVAVAGSIFFVGSLLIAVYRLWRYEMAERL
jgi:ABC-2 type transport system permease protein